MAVRREALNTRTARTWATPCPVGGPAASMAEPSLGRDQSRHSRRISLVGAVVMQGNYSLMENLVRLWQMAPCGHGNAARRGRSTACFTCHASHWVARQGEDARSRAWPSGRSSAYGVGAKRARAPEGRVTAGDCPRAARDRTRTHGPLAPPRTAPRCARNAASLLSRPRLCRHTRGTLPRSGRP